MREKSATATSDLSTISSPPGAEPDVWEGNPRRRTLYRIAGCIDTGVDPLSMPLVCTEGIQWGDGLITDTGVSTNCPSDPPLSSTQARDFARLVAAAADEADTWARWIR